MPSLPVSVVQAAPRGHRPVHKSQDPVQVPAPSQFHPAPLKGATTPGHGILLQAVPTAVGSFPYSWENIAA